MGNPTRCLFIGLDGAIPPVVQRYISEGHLPNLKRLSERGAWFEHCLPAFPTITPTCWSTIATGAPPGVHGVTCHQIHEPGSRFDRPLSGYRSEMTQGERIWEAAERGERRSLVLQYPTSGPSRLRQGFQVNGTACSALEYTPLGVPVTGAAYHGVPGQLFVVPSPGLELVPALEDESAQQMGVPRDDRPVLTVALPAAVGPSLYDVEPFGWTAELRASGTVRLKDESGLLAELGPGDWTPILSRQLGTSAGDKNVRYRVKVLEASYDQRLLRLYVTPPADAGPACSPDDFAELVTALPGLPTFDHHHGPFGNGQLDDETFLEIERGNFAWLRGVVAETWRRHECALTFVYAVLLDSINHKYRNVLEEAVPADPVTTERARRTELAGYQLVDSFVGELLALADAETLVIVASDHGSTGYTQRFDPREALRQAGLYTTCSGPSDGAAEVDWERTRAVPFSSVHVYVNLAGREPQGIVPPERYEQTVQEIIRALYDYTDEATGMKPVALALPRRDARLLGLGGDRTGDVVYGVTSNVGGWVGGVHACQIPTVTSVGGGDIRSLLIMAGPGVKEGVRVDRTARLMDIAPTICHLLDLPRPSQCEGGPLYQALV